VSFNASKSVSTYVGKHKLSSDLYFCIDGNKIEFVNNNGVHLGHVIWHMNQEFDSDRQTNERTD